MKIIKCPKCNKDLFLDISKEEKDEIIEGTLCCKSGHMWNVTEGVVDFKSKEQEEANNWTESYKEADYEEIDRRIFQGTPENQREINIKALNYIIDRINNNEDEFILDIATGRGMLFTEMVRKLKTNSQIICTDLSFQVLKYDRMKAKKINPEVKVNYIACDAAKLPFIDNSIDVATSFYGIANMLGATFEGIKEANRVLKSKHNLYNTFINIKEDSKGFSILKQFCMENTIAGVENFSLKNEIEKYHYEAGFTDIKTIKIGESIGEKCEFDLLPFENEWFSIIVAVGTK